MTVESWDEQTILRTLGQWAWSPDGSEVIDTDDYRLAFWPASFGGGAHVPLVESSRTAEELIAEVHEVVRSRGFTEVVWSVSPATLPVSLGDRLGSLGAVIRDESALLSRPVPADGRLDVGPTPDVVVRQVTDLERLTDYRRIVSTVFEQELPSTASIAAEAAGLSPDDPGGCRFVAYVDETPAGTGAIGIGPHGGASLFGAATYPALRRRGAHRAVLAARARWAYDHGVPIMLVKGRLTTSAPTLLRAGFTLHGHHRELAVQLMPRA